MNIVKLLDLDPCYWDGADVAKHKDAVRVLLQAEIHNAGEAHRHTADRLHKAKARMELFEAYLTLAGGC